MTRPAPLDVDESPEEYHHLFTDESLGDRRTELVVLAAALARDARCERHQHVDIARDDGVSLAAVDLPSEGGEFCGWVPDAGTVAELSD